MKIILERIKGKDIRGCQIVEENCFRELFEKKQLTKKQFIALGYNHRIWTRSVKKYYTKERVEELRRKKIRKGKALSYGLKWRDRATILESFKPGIIDLVESDDYRSAIEKVVEINDMVYEAKEAVRLVLKHLRHGAKRRGIRINLIANALEFKMKKILMGMGIEFIPQYRIGIRSYDFKLLKHKILLEVDGRFHSERVDTIKDKLAKKKGYTLIRIPEKEIKNVYFIKDKINKTIGEKVSM